MASINWEKLAKAETNRIRLHILELMVQADRPIAPVELAELARVEVGKAGYHCRELEKSGLIELHHDEPVRGTVKHYFSLAKDGE